MGAIGAMLEGAAFGLLYSFPTKEEAEAHAEYLRIVGMQIALYDEQGNLS